MGATQHENCLPRTYSIEAFQKYAGLGLGEGDSSCICPLQDTFTGGGNRPTVADLNTLIPRSNL